MTSITEDLAVQAANTRKVVATDLVTIAHAMLRLETSYLGAGTTWQPTNTEQERYLAWFELYRDRVASLKGLESMAALSHEPLNAFLVKRRFEPQFRPFTGVGVASVLDMLVEWIRKGQLTDMRYWVPGTDSPETCPAFVLQPGQFQVYAVDGHNANNPLVSIDTKTGEKVWLMPIEAPHSGLDLALFAQQVLDTGRRPHPWIDDTLTVPMIDLDVKPDLNWMLRLSSIAGRDGSGHSISQAFQQFKLRANETGARIKIATGISNRSIGGPVAVKFNRPFMWFTTKPEDPELAMGSIYVGTDAWKMPAGSLEDL